MGTASQGLGQRDGGAVIRAAVSNSAADGAQSTTIPGPHEVPEPDRRCVPPSVFDSNANSDFDSNADFDSSSNADSGSSSSSSSGSSSASGSGSGSGSHCRGQLEGAHA